MGNRTLLLVVFALFTIKVLNCQTIRHRPETVLGRSCNNCDSEHKWDEISSDKLLKSTPFNKIFHLSFKRHNDIPHYGTASFVSEDLLVTARHCVHHQQNLEYLELTSASVKNRWVRLNKKDFKIYYYTEKVDSRANDIALIRIINQQKLKLLYSGHFELTDGNYDSVKEINITGFPYIKFAINSISPDTLVNRNGHSV
jgi:hypothetical protein